MGLIQKAKSLLINKKFARKIGKSLSRNIVRENYPITSGEKRMKSILVHSYTVSKR